MRNFFPPSSTSSPEHYAGMLQRAEEAKQRSAQSTFDTWHRLAPAEQNQSIATFGDVDPETGIRSNEGRPAGESQWGAYSRVLAHRGAQLNQRAYPAEDQLPAGYTEGQLDSENATALAGGQAPRWAGSQNLPSSQRRIAQSLQGLQRSGRQR